MKMFPVVLILLLASGSGAVAGSEVLLDGPAREDSVRNLLYLERLPSFGAEASSALGFRAGQITFNHLEFGNDYSSFAYADGEAPSVGVSYEAFPMQFLGAWGAYASLDYAFYKGQVSSRDEKVSGRSYVSLFPVSLGAVYVAQFHPLMRFFAPSVSVGAGYNLIFQGGELDHFHARAAEWSFKRSLGFRHSLSWIGLKSSQLTADLILQSPLVSKTENGDRFDTRTLSLGFSSNL